MTYDHTIVHTKHENVSSIHAVIGEFARRAIMNGGSARRRLAAGDFDELNALLEGTIFLLPDQFQNVDVPWPFTSVDIFLTQIQCTDVYIEDLILSPSVRSVRFPLELMRLELMRLEHRYNLPKRSMSM